MEKETNYVAPVVEVIEVEVEKGFQASEVPGAGEDPFQGLRKRLGEKTYLTIQIRTVFLVFT